LGWTHLISKEEEEGKKKGRQQLTTVSLINEKGAMPVPKVRLAPRGKKIDDEEGFKK